MKNKLLIVTGKFIPEFKDIKKYDFAGVEYGCIKLHNEKIKPIFCIGDFDSITKTQKNTLKTKYNVIELSVDKDQTDLEEAIIEAKSLGYNDISVAIEGNRLDHLVFQIKLVKKYGVKVYDKFNKITRAINKDTITKEKYKYVSFVSEKKQKISITGLKYNVENVKIDSTDTKFVSNEIKKTFATVECKHPIIVIQSND